MPKMSFNDLVAMMQQTQNVIRSKEFTDTELQALPDESFAKLAFECNQPLQREFPDERSFLHYWRSLRGKRGTSRMRLKTF